MATQPLPTFRYFDVTRDWRRDAPSELITLETARARKRQGVAYFVPGTDCMCELPKQAIQQQRGVDEDADGKVSCNRSEWKIVNQTGKAGVKHKDTRIGPGEPRFSMV
jgi:hypothetical protein